MKGNFIHKNFAHILFIVILLSCITTAGVGVQSPTTKLYVDPSKVEYWTPPAFNETFTINITIANVSDLKGFEFKLYWNTTLLDLVKVNTPPFLNPPITIAKNETSEDLGRYWLAIASTGEPKTGSGALATLSFKITYNPIWPENVTSALDLADTELRNSKLDPIPHDVYDGEYSCYSTPPLGITTMTDRPSYWLVDKIHIYGNLTLGFSPVQDGLVALQIDDPLNRRVVIRTLLTGSPPASQIVEIISVIPCRDPYGHPKSSFNKGDYVFFNITVRNNDVKTRRVLVSVNLYDAKTRSLGTTMFEVPVLPGKIAQAIPSIPIPSWASSGGATVYVSAFTGLPKNGGIAYCPEKSAALQILGSSSAGGSSSSSSGGTYDLTFKLPFDPDLAAPGNYTMYANSNYTIHDYTQKATSNVTFEVKVPDVDNDGDVDLFDVVKVALAYDSLLITDPGDPRFGQYWHSPPCRNCPHSPSLDFDQDGDIDLFDVVKVALHYDWH